MKIITIRDEEYDLIMQLLHTGAEERNAIGWHAGAQSFMNLADVFSMAAESLQTHDEVFARMHKAEALLNKLEREGAHFDKLCDTELGKISKLHLRRSPDESLSGAVKRVVEHRDGLLKRLQQLQDDLDRSRCRAHERAVASAQQLENLQVELSHARACATAAETELEAINDLPLGQEHQEHLVDAVRNVMDHRNEMSLALENLFEDAEILHDSSYRISARSYNAAATAYNGYEHAENLRAKLARSEHDRIEAEGCLWRIQPNAHTLEMAEGFPLGVTKPDPFEGPGETYAAAYERLVKAVHLLKKVEQP